MNEDLNIAGSLNNEIKRKAILASIKYLDGIVCSPNDIKYIKDSLPNNFYYVTPGIRSKSKSIHDHKRTATYKDAITLGSKLLVFGREVIESTNRRSFVQKIIADVKTSLEAK